MQDTGASGGPQKTLQADFLQTRNVVQKKQPLQQVLLSLWFSFCFLLTAYSSKSMINLPPSTQLLYPSGLPSLITSNPMDTAFFFPSEVSPLLPSLQLISEDPLEPVESSCRMEPSLVIIFLPSHVMSQKPVWSCRWDFGV